jgi:two-component system, NtrC family, response regulator HydG
MAGPATPVPLGAPVAQRVKSVTHMSISTAMNVESLESSVTRSPAMKEVIGLARRLADVDCTVLISGESGTGKERIARFLHDASPRASGPFIAINCGALTETLLESELFGHARGSFTGAADHRAGLFEAADGGSLLLDELGEISTAMQVKLLRALQTREVRRVGENKPRAVNVRILAATNSDLTQAVAKGTFRQDLYYRLKVVELRLPPLRARSEDVLTLARQLLSAAASRMQRKVTGFSSEVSELLLRHEWPGNVRELENAMDRGVALARGELLEVDDLPDELRGVGRPASSVTTRTLAQVEREHILAALELHGGNQTRTARVLQIGSATLYRKLKSYGVLTPRRQAPRWEPGLTLMS